VTRVVLEVRALVGEEHQQGREKGDLLLWVCINHRLRIPPRQGCLIGVTMKKSVFGETLKENKYGCRFSAEITETSYLRGMMQTNKGCHKDCSFEVLIYLFLVRCIQLF
jgi:hypothetical protein